MAKVARLLNLTAALLESPLPLTAEEIRSRVNGYPDGDIAFHRAFERDKDALRELGVPVDTVTVHHFEIPKAGYTIDERRYSLKDPQFTPEESAALQLARAAVMFEGIEPNEVEDTFRKLGGVEAGGTGSGTLGSIPLSDELTQIFEAINERRTLEFVYGEETRVVEPLVLQFERGRWYLSAFDPARQGMRNFRVDRITGRPASGEPDSFQPRDVDTTLVTSPWAAGSDDPLTATILVDKEPAGATLMEYEDLEVVERREDASVVVRAQVRNIPGFFTFMAGLLERAEIVGPPDLREAYIAWLSQRLTSGTVEREDR